MSRKSPQLWECPRHGFNTDYRSASAGWDLSVKALDVFVVGFDTTRRAPGGDRIEKVKVKKKRDRRSLTPISSSTRLARTSDRSSARGDRH